MSKAPKTTPPSRGLFWTIGILVVLAVLAWFLWPLLAPGPGPVPELESKPAPQQEAPAPEPSPAPLPEPEPLPAPEPAPEPAPAPATETPTPAPRTEIPPAGLQLGPPLLCDPGRDCWVSTYFDHDPGPGHKDQTCGPVTYDTHGGIDFAIPNLAAMERGVTVIASAGGVVVGTRDAMADINIDDIDPASLNGQDCGNGVRLDHGDGWATQYCHMKQGSVLVRTGQTVEVGTPLGQVGLSGRTQHPHVHISVTKDGVKLDPYTGTSVEAGCEASGTALWTPETLEAFRYRTGLIRDLVLSPRLPEREEVQAGTAGASEASVDAEALVLSIETMANLRDHKIEMTIHDPAGRLVASGSYDQPKVYTYARIGKKRPEVGWPPGTYTGEASIRNGRDEITDSRKVTIDLK